MPMSVSTCRLRQGKLRPSSAVSICCDKSHLWDKGRGALGTGRGTGEGNVRQPPQDGPQGSPTPGDEVTLTPCRTSAIPSQLIASSLPLLPP